MSEPLLLLPGMMCDARLFAPQIAAFSVTRSVMVAPLVGHSSISALADDVLSNAPRRFALAGLSMGGIVAMEVVRQAPERVTRLALMDTNPLADHPHQVTVRDAQIARVATGKLRQVMRDEMKPLYLAEGQRKDSILALCMAMTEALGTDVFISQSYALQKRPDQSETLRKIKVPSLVLCGAEDRLCPLERHQLMLNLIPNATMVIIKGAGHLPTLEQPELTNKALEDWLNL